MENQMPPPPADVQDQTWQIVQSGVAHMVYPDVGVAGDLDDLLFWAGLQEESCCTLLSVFARRRDGGLGKGIVRQSATWVARNSIATPEPLAHGPVLDFARLQLLERLALGAEEFDFEPGQQYMRTHVPLPGYEGKHMAAGDVLTVESVYLAWINFAGGYQVPRRLVCGTYFRFCA